MCEYSMTLAIIISLPANEWSGRIEYITDTSQGIAGSLEPTLEIYKLCLACSGKVTLVSHQFHLKGAASSARCSL